MVNNNDFRIYPVDPRYMNDSDEEPRELTLGKRFNDFNAADVYNSHKALCFPDYLGNYSGPLPYSTPQYQHPELYFWAVDGKLRVLGFDLEIDFNRSDFEQHKKITDTLGEGWTREPLLEIYRYLQAQPFSEYYKALLAFKWDARLQSFPLFEQFDLVQMIDGKLFGMFLRPKRKQIHLSNGRVIHPPPQKKNGKEKREQEFVPLLLTERTVGSEIKRLKGQSNIADYKKTNLAKCLAKLHQNDPYAKKNDEAKMSVHYYEGVLQYIPTMAKARFSEEYPSEISALLLSMGNLPDALRVSDTLESSLLCLTGGDLDKLDTLAELFARIFCRDIPSKYLWYIHGNCAGFAEWLFQLVDGKMDDTIYANHYRKEKNMVYDQAAQFLIQINFLELSSEQFEKINHKQLGRYIEGDEPVYIRDPYQVGKIATYSPLVSFVSSGESIDTAKAFKKLHWKEIDVPVGWTFKTLSTKDYQWLKTCFVAKGLQLVHGIERRQAEQVTPEQLVHQFAADFCEIDPDSRINCKVFREALLEYESTLPYEVKLGGSTTLNKLVAGRTGWKYEDDRRNGNQKAFYHVRINMDKLRKTIEENKARKEQERQARIARTFREYLDEITELVLWPPVSP